MESKMEELLNKISSTPDTVGCVLTNQQGLCIGNRGKASASSSGIIFALAQEAHKLHPDEKSPVVSMDFGDLNCVVHSEGEVTAGVYKKSHKK